ncbi:MAG: hypothetical protein M1830_005998 [Pleopsidium flavum]|nr:MAG: hypothetical protein M1830_005998 [Pleopsidium flavum]
MPIQISRQALLASLPSFMSVFGESLDTKERKVEGAAATKESSTTAIIANNKSPNTDHPPPQQQHRDSTSTINSESTDSSPTTTISTLDSSSTTEPSPSSSPESAISITPLSSFKALRSSDHSSEQGLMEPPPSSLPNLPGLNRPESPGRKVRNTKNLSLNMSASIRQGPQLPKLAISTASAVKSTHPLSAPASPSFIVPPKPPKRKPSRLGLTISTPGLGVPNMPGGNGLSIVPSTPAISRPSTLRHFQSSPSLSVFSPTTAPEGGMQLPPFGNQNIPRRLGQVRPLIISQKSSYESSDSSPLAVRQLGEVEEENDYEPPLSQEAKSPAYPEGPVCVYHPHVFLYLEPSEEEASTFDVVLNVAREVQNPFTLTGRTGQKQDKEESKLEVVSEMNGVGAEDQDMPEPQTAVSEVSFRSAFETLPSTLLTTSPTTPKAAKPDVEYIHIPWDHNTNIVDDMLRLCELIDDRVRQGKRVLIHCQCGVSRSASLIVAYGLYKNPELSVQDAYDAVKKRSRWIGPNMNLIYQLSEFRNKLPRTSPPAPSGWRTWRTLGKGRSNTGGGINSTTRSTLFPAIAETPSIEPHSAPLPVDKDCGSECTQFLSPVSSPSNTTASCSGEITPGPSSAPPDMQWSPTGPSSEEREARGEGNKIELGPAAFGSLSKSDDMHIDGANISGKAVDDDKNIGKDSYRILTADPPLPGGFSGMKLTQPVSGTLPFRREPSSLLSNVSNRQIELRLDNAISRVPPTPLLLSPRAAEFTASPFHRTVAGDLVTSAFEAGLSSPKILDDDPRSPAQRGEAPITRSIFDVL